jgi:hypothetical protein
MQLKIEIIFSKWKEEEKEVVTWLMVSGSLHYSLD